MAKKRGSTRRATTKKATARRLKARLSQATPVSLESHLEGIRFVATAFEASGGEQGACLVADPQTGENRCLRTDPATCKALKGTFIGGPCGA